MAGIYVHIPFCKSRCSYCDFYSQTSQLGAGFVTQVLNELEERKGEIVGEKGGENEEVTTVYFGGGTPSAMAAEDLLALVRGLLEKIDIEKIREFTIEANPDDVARGNFPVEQLAQLITPQRLRISMGVQTMVDEELRKINRRHNAQEVRDSVEKIRQAGVTNYSLDLIYGLPLQTKESLEYSLNEIIALKPNHISAYSLTVEEGTPLYRSGFKPLDEQTYEEFYRLVRTTLAKNGYIHYEISNYALPGKEAVHNSSYWFGEPYIGLGPSAHSFSKRNHQNSVRSYNTPYVKGWENIIEEEDKVDKINDLIVAGLRTIYGVDLKEICCRTYAEEYLPKLERIFGSQPEGSLEFMAEKGRWRIPQSKWFVSDAIIREILLED